MNLDFVELLAKMPAQEKNAAEQALKVASAVKTAETMPVEPMPAQNSSLEELFREKFQAGLEQQRQQAEMLKQRLEEEQADPRNSTLSRLDLRPFAEAIKGYGATNVATAQAPEDRTKIKMALEEMVTKAQQGISDDELAYIKTQLDAENAIKKDAREERKFQALLAKGDSSESRYGYGKDFEIRKTVNNSEEAKQVKAATMLNDKVNNVERVLSEIGDRAYLTGKEKAALDSAYSELQIAWKNAADLGALVGGDFKMIETGLGESPTSLAGIGKYAIAGGIEGIRTKLANARNMATSSGVYNLENLKTVYPYPVAQPIYGRFQKELESSAKGTPLSGGVSSAGATRDISKEIQDVDAEIKKLEAKKLQDKKQNKSP